MNMFSLEREPRAETFLAELIKGIEEGKIKNKDGLEVEKLRLAKKHGIYSVVKNAELIEYARQLGKNNLIEFLRTKPVRTRSGIANIAVMWKGPLQEEGKFFSCPGNCIYCPQGEDSPKAYCGVEPTTMRARRFNYDPFLQVQNRLKQFNLLGHNTDKCELIIMGGTFTAMPISFQEEFVKRCLDAFNDAESGSLAEAQQKNETAPNRCVGLTIETRADYCSSQIIEELLRMGCTRIELGIQTTSDEILKAINRGHTASDNIDAIRRVKEAGLKFTAHWMPGLTGLLGEPDMKKELELFRQLFTQEYQPDELKIYPLIILPGTELYNIWKAGEFKVMENDVMAELLIRMKEIIPPWVRVKRIMRDISEHEAEGGTRTTNLRQLISVEMKKKGIRCRCIRCREIGLDKIDESKIKLNTIIYEASGGEEYFLSMEDDKDRLIGFLRLRLDNEVAKIRELHIYGEMTPLGKRIAYQHTGLGKQLMKKVEEISREKGKKVILVTSGLGVRDYYRKLGYVLEGNYMTKKLK